MVILPIKETNTKGEGAQLNNQVMHFGDREVGGNVIPTLPVGRTFVAEDLTPLAAD